MNLDHRARLALASLATLVASVTGIALAPAASAASTVTVATVQASVRPNATGVTLTAGDSATITAAGVWDTCGGGCPTDANGIVDGFNADFVAPTARGGSLIGSLDGGTTWFAVGVGPTTIAGPGTLLLADNDFNPSVCDWCYGDNSGSMTVTITVTPAAPAVPTDKAQCKADGWRTFNLFKNQGDCVSYVATHGRNQPAG
ncbi:MAG: hypothetical protein JWN67_1889 [Actinomycetia bacterium]|nr:hypothetical protein [Actinomycetes bacterium]